MRPTKLHTKGIAKIKGPRCSRCHRKLDDKNLAKCKRCRDLYKKNILENPIQC